MLDCVAKVWYENTEKSNLIGMIPSETYDVTEINGTPESVKEYFAIGKMINLGFGQDRKGKIHEDHLMKVRKVFVLKQNEQTEKFISHLGEKYGWDWKEHFCEEEWQKFIS